MPALKNAKHEAFAKGVACGSPAYQAYMDAGYTTENAASAATSAYRLLKNVEILNRIEQIRDTHAKIDAKAVEIAAKKLSITKESVLAELAKIGFSDIRNVMTWGPEILVEGENGKALIVNGVYVKPSDQIDDFAAGAISEIRQTKEGIVVKLHDKKGALLDLLKYVDPESQPDGSGAKDITPGSAEERDHLAHLTQRFSKFAVVEGGQAKKQGQK